MEWRWQAAGGDVVDCLSLLSLRSCNRGGLELSGEKLQKARIRKGNSRLGSSLTHQLSSLSSAASSPEPFTCAK